MKLTNNDKKYLHRYIKFLSYLLNIKIDNYFFVEHRTRLLVKLADNKMLFDLNIAPADHNSKPDLFHAIAHELRHAYQICSSNNAINNDFYSNSQLETITKELNDARDLDLVNKLSKNEYNNRLVEIDANAFASFVMYYIFEINIIYQEDLNINGFESIEKSISNYFTYSNVISAASKSNMNTFDCKQWLIS